MLFQTTKSFILRISKSLLIISTLILMQSLPLSAKPFCLSAQFVQTSLTSGKCASNVSLVEGAYFMVLLGVGYGIKRYFNFRKKKENAE